MTDATTDAPKKKGGLMKIIKLLVGAIIIGGGGFGAGIFYSGQQLSPSEEVLRLVERTSSVEAEAAEAEEGEGAGPQRVPKDIPETAAFETNYYEFPDALTTNLKGSRRFLQVSIGLSTQYDEQVIGYVESHAMALRSDMLGVISGFSEEDIAGIEGRDALSDALLIAVNARLETLEGFGGIEDVFFPSFVLQ